MRSALVLGGRFKVYENGTVNKYFDGVETPATTIPTGRDKKYLVVSYQSNGKQKHAYVHRLIATAFIPNPDRLPQVNHIDGDARNNMVSNLEWCTAQRNIKHAYETGLIIPNSDGVICKICGTLTKSEDGICWKCKKKIETERKREEEIEKRAARFSAVNLDLCSDREKQFVEMAANGATQREIAETYGVSTQCVGMALLNAERKTVEGVRVPNAVKDERIRLMKKAGKLKEKYDNAVEKANIIKNEYENAMMAFEQYEKTIEEKYGCTVEV